MEQYRIRKKSVDLMEISTGHKKILDEELTAYKKCPASGPSWEEVKARIKREHSE